MTTNTLYDLRKEARLTVADLAKRARVSVAYVRQVETGKVELTRSMAEQLAIGLDVSVDELFQPTKGQ